MAAKIESLEILINGRLSPSVVQSLQRAESMLKQFGASQKTAAAFMSRAYSTAFGSMSSGMDKAVAHANRFHDALQNIGAISAGVAIGDTLFKGLEAGVGLIERGADAMGEMSRKASEAASQFELLSKGMGALLRDQGFANDLLDQLQKVAYKSPFQLTDLGSVARELTGRGMDKNQLFQSTTELGDITAGLGGGPEILNRLSLAYGEAFDEKVINKRILNQFSQAGVPMMDAMMKAFGMDSKNEAEVQRFFKMVHDKQVSFKDVDKAIFNLTHNGGLFTDGMLHFAATFQGILTTFEDLWSRTERDFGNTLNDWIGDFLKFVNSSGVWDQMHDWLSHLRVMSQSVIDFVHTLPTAEMNAVFGRFQGVFDGFNKWLRSFFTMQYMPGIGSSPILNEMGQENIRKAIDNVTTAFKDISDFFLSQPMKDLAALAVDQLQNTFADIGMIINVLDDIFGGPRPNFGKAMLDFHSWSDRAFGKNDNPDQNELYKHWAPVESQGMQDHWRKLDSFYETIGKLQPEMDALGEQTTSAANALKDLNDAVSARTGGGSSLGGNAGLHGGLSNAGPSSQGFKSYESYPWEGHAANYGFGDTPMVNEQDYHIGVDAARKLGLKHDDWFHIKGGGWGRYHDTSERSWGVEKHTAHPGSTPDRLDIDQISHNKPVTYAPVFNIQVLDASGVHRVLQDHGEMIKSHLDHLAETDWARAAVV